MCHASCTWHIKRSHIYGNATANPTMTGLVGTMWNARPKMAFFSSDEFVLNVFNVRMKGGELA